MLDEDGDGDCVWVSEGVRACDRVSEDVVVAVTAWDEDKDAVWVCEGVTECVPVFS